MTEQTIAIVHKIDEQKVYSITVKAQVRQKFRLNFDNTPTQIMTPDLQMAQMMAVFAEQQPPESLWRHCYRSFRRIRLARISIDSTRYITRVNPETQLLEEKSVNAEDAGTFRLHNDTNVNYNNLLLGDAVVFYAYRQVASLEGFGIVCPAFTIVGFVPWFFAPEFYQEKRDIRWEHIAVNTMLNLLPSHIKDSLRRIEQPMPFLPLSGGEAAPPMEVTDAHRRQLLALVLRWHQKRHAQPPPHIKAKAEITKWRDSELNIVLNSRSFVFFGRESPRMAFLNKSFGWDVIIETLRSFCDLGAASFVVNQLCELLKYVMKTEFESRGELAAFYFMKNFMHVLAAGISSSYLAQLQEESKKVDDMSNLLKSISETTTSAEAVNVRPGEDIYTARLECRAYAANVRDLLHKCLSEPIDLQIRVGQELLASKQLPLDKLYFITAPPETDAQKEMEYEEPSDEIKRFFVKDAVVVSYSFSGGTELVAKALIGESVASQSKQHQMVLSKGVVYVGRLTALGCCVNLMRQFLLQHYQGNGSRKKKQTELERLFVGALPKHNGVYYPEESRVAEFDDIGLASIEHRTVMVPTMNMRLFAEFQAHTNGIDRMPLPASFNAPRALGLTRTTDELLKMRKLSNSVYTSKLGAVQIDRAALIGVLHRADCYQSPASVASSKRAHITIEFDQEKREEIANETLKQCDTLAARTALDEFDTHVGGKHCCSSTSPENQFPGIEDLVRNLYDNRAMPLCMRNLAETIVERRDHLRHEERLIMYRMLISLKLPELKHQHIMRFMMTYTPRGTIHSQFMELRHPETMLQNRQDDAVKGYMKAKVDNGRPDVTEEDALAATTCAKSCNTMQKDNKNRHCPLVTHSDDQLSNLIRRSGVDDSDTIREIVQMAKKDETRNAACRHQMHMSRPVETRSTPFYSDKTFDVFPPKHPYQMVYLAADHLQRHRERQAASNNNNNNNSFSSVATKSSASMYLHNEDSSSMYVETEAELRRLKNSDSE